MGWGLVQLFPNLIFLAILFVVTRYVLMLIRLFFGAVESRMVQLGDFDPVWSKPTYRLVRIAVIILAVVVAYPYIPGSDSEAFKGVSLFVGVLISLGSTSLIGNIIAGYTMTYRRTFKIGDRVRIGDHIGYVQQSRLMATYLRTPKNEMVVVPNSKIINEEVVNYSTLARGRGLILHTTVNVGYDAPWRQVEAMLLEAAARTNGILRKPKPFVRQKVLGDFAVSYELNGYCDQPRAIGRLYSRLHQNILDLFNEYGIQIMTPAYESDPNNPKVVPPDRWYAAPARLVSSGDGQKDFRFFEYFLSVDMPAVRIFIAAVVDRNRGSMKRNSCKHSLGFGIGIDTGLQQDIRAHRCSATNGPGGSGCVYPKFQFGFQQGIDRVVIREDQYHVGCFHSELEPKASAGDIDEGRRHPVAALVSA
jgi:small-conductance mechanosensitive channel